jgi:hypothetical protein
MFEPKVCTSSTHSINPKLISTAAEKGKDRTYPLWFPDVSASVPVLSQVVGPGQTCGSDILTLFHAHI